MVRREFIQKSTALAASSTLTFTPTQPKEANVKKPTDRAYWLEVMTRIAKPVLEALSEQKLKQSMPVESKPGHETNRRSVTYLEAFGRLMAGISPWLELGGDDTEEGKLRKKYLQLALQGLTHAVDPASADFMNFTQGGQPLVDAAFLAHALLRAPTQLTQQIDSQTRQHLIEALKSTRVIKPSYNNWLLFSAMVEAALFKLGEPYDSMRVDYAVRQHLNWYKGDGLYGDGPNFHFDYYNSFVIQPMLLDVVAALELKEPRNLYPMLLQRAQRYAEIQERLISPEGTFPAVGRSLAYRFGAFQLLAQVALMQKLPQGLEPSQVRSALTAVIRRMMEAPGTFDKNGWLTVGFCGHQPSIGENYISTGSVYLCSTGLLPLGLPASNGFWAAAPADWTAKKVWSGIDIANNSALYE
jgi:hypothetical protein